MNEKQNENMQDFEGIKVKQIMKNITTSKEHRRNFTEGDKV